MGNIGRPSGGCLTCKKRKIKCDETRPFCNRCKKANRECPGVPDPTSLAFRPGYPGSRARDDSPTDTQSSCQSAIIEEVHYPIEPQAIALFFHDYANRSGDPRLTKSKPIVDVPQVYLTSLTSEPIHYALTACSLAVLSRYTKSLEVLGLAKNKYVESLHSVRRALGSPETATKDSTLSGILMMMHWELHAASEDSLDPFYKHKMGAIEILRKRGSAQFHDPGQLQKFRAWRSHLIMSSFDSETPRGFFDDETFDWFGDRDLPDETYENSRLAEIGFKVTRLRSRIALEFDTQPTLPAMDFCVNLNATYDDDDVNASKTPDDIEEEDIRLAELCDEADHFDDEISSWIDDVPPEWLPVVVALQEPRSDVWNGIVYFYHRPLAAVIFTFAFSLRIILNGLLIKMHLRRKLPPPPASLYKIRMSVDAICATIPFVLGFENGIVPNRFKNNYIDEKGWARANTSFHMHGMFFAAAVGDMVPLDQRRWIKRCLEYAHSNIAYGVAGILASNLGF